MTGALHYHGMSVKDAMTPLKNTFMFGADERLGFDTVAKIFKTGYSQIPVHEVTKSNVIGLLFVKDLIFLDPKDEIPVKNFVQIFGRGLHIVWPEDKLGNVLTLLKKGRSHMAFVRDVNNGDGTLDQFHEIKRIITLEDIIEIILGDEIMDETDKLVEVNNPVAIWVSSYQVSLRMLTMKQTQMKQRAVCQDGKQQHRKALTGHLDFVYERLVDLHLSPDKVRDVAAHLKTNYPRVVELISDKQLKGLLSSVPVMEITPAQTCAFHEGNNDVCNWIPTDRSELLYERGMPADFCTIVLSGKLTVLSGANKFLSDISNWRVLGTMALTDPSYIPDFSAWVVPTPHGTSSCRCIKLDCKLFFHILDNTAFERTGHAVIDIGSRPCPGHTILVDTRQSSEMTELETSPDPLVFTQPTYVVQEEQKLVHKQCSKLLHAFIYSKKHEYHVE
ncbi:LOW QUALITY PROTEIN: hypothetical protein ACHAW6_005766 [Cyclotella cf. meneghiniana]